MNLKELEKICKKATPGPWVPHNENDEKDLAKYDYYKKTWTWSFADWPRAWETDTGSPGYGLSIEDAKFCCVAREMMPKLIAVVKAAIAHADICEDAGDSLQALQDSIREIER